MSRSSDSKDLKVARYLDYYGSEKMRTDCVKRLYNDALHNHLVNIRQLEYEYYPPLNAPIRSKEEIQEYLQKRVTEDIFRRQCRLLAKENALYPSSMQHLTRKELENQVKRMYDKYSLQKESLKSYPTEKHSAASEDPYKSQEQKKLEQGWKSTWNRNHRKKETAAFDEPLPFTHRNIKGSFLEGENHRLSPRDKKSYFVQLSKPLHITSKKKLDSAQEKNYPSFVF